MREIQRAKVMKNGNVSMTVNVLTHVDEVWSWQISDCCSTLSCQASDKRLSHWAKEVFKNCKNKTDIGDKPEHKFTRQSTISMQKEGHQPNSNKPPMKQCRRPRYPPLPPKLGYIRGRFGGISPPQTLTRSLYTTWTSPSRLHYQAPTQLGTPPGNTRFLS